MDLGLSPDEIALQQRARAFAREVARPRALRSTATSSTPGTS